MIKSQIFSLYFNIIVAFFFSTKTILSANAQNSEKFFFHGTSDDAINKICLVGFGIGGVDFAVRKDHKQPKYGFGVYVSQEASTSLK